MENKMNLTLLADFYEITMANGYLEHGVADQIAYYDMFFRRIPDNGGFAIMAGLEQVIDYLKNLHFTREDIAYLRSKKCFSEKFLDYLANFEFCCDVWAIPEGMPGVPRRTAADGARAGHSGAVSGNYGAADHQSSVSDRHQSKPHCAGC